MNQTNPVRFDHLVIAASSCELGVDWLETLLGIRLPAGGKHPLMGTHNHLSALSENSFLELIAIDPEAESPAHPRWFSLDDPETREAVNKQPQLLTWVVATQDLDQSLMQARNAGIDPGEPVTLTRDDLSWRLSLHKDGSLSMGGLFPILIEWPEGVNPVIRMQNQGLTLNSLELSTEEPERLQSALEAIGWVDAAMSVRVINGKPCINAGFALADREFHI